VDTTEDTTAEDTTAESTTEDPTVETSEEPSTTSSSSSSTSSSSSQDDDTTAASTSEEPIIPDECEASFVEVALVNSNPTFTSNDSWIEDQREGGSAEFNYAHNGESEIFIRVLAAGTVAHSLQLRQDIQMVAGQSYRIEFTARSRPETTRDLGLVTDNGEDGGYQTDPFCGRTTVSLTDEAQTFYICCTAQQTADVRLIVEFGGTFAGG